MNNSVDLPLVFRNLAAAYPALIQFMEAAAYILGGISVLFALFDLYRQHGQSHPGRVSNNAWAWGFGIAILLFTLPSFIQAGGNQFFGNVDANPLGYAQTAASGPTLAPLAGALQIFGMFFTIRGLWVLREVGIYGRTGNATLGKGYTQIICGILLVNLKLFLQVLSSVTGLQLGAGLFS